MVQVLDIDPRSRISEMLGMGLGQGLGTGLATYFANRSLNSVLQDKAMEGAPLSKKLSAIQSALSPYGEIGEKLFNNRVAIEQQEHEEKSNKKKGPLLGKYLAGGQLTPEEESLFTPQELLAMHKARYPKTTGGISNQSVPPEISRAVDDIIKEYPNASADELKGHFDRAAIPPGYTNQYIENRRRSEERGGEHDIKFHQESAEFEKNLRSDAQAARRQLTAIEDIRKSLKEGKIKPNTVANILRQFGSVGEKLADAFLNKGEAGLLAALPEFLEGKRELFGVRLSDTDVRLLLQSMAGLGKSKEANEAFLDVVERTAKRALAREKIADEVLEKEGIPYRSGKLRPLGYEGKVAKAFDEAMLNEGTFEEAPPAASYPGKKIEDSYGNRYRSNGQYWEPVQQGEPQVAAPAPAPQPLQQAAPQSIHERRGIFSNPHDWWNPLP